MKHRSPALLATVLLSGALTLSACNNGAPSSSPTDAENTPAGDAPSTAAPAAGGTDGGQTDASQAASPAALGEEEQGSSDDPDWDTGSDGQEASEDNTLTIAEVRVGSHDDYTRIVLEFDGEGTPGWNAPQWDTDVNTMGKGDPISVKGDHTLVIHGTGTASTPPSGQRTTGQQRFDLDKGDNDEGIDEVVVDPGLEGEFQVVLGTDSQTYRVFTLSDPTRLVIDVADDDSGGSDDSTSDSDDSTSDAQDQSGQDNDNRDDNQDQGDQDNNG